MDLGPYQTTMAGRYCEKTAESCKLFLQKNSIIDIWQDSKCVTINGYCHEKPRSIKKSGLFRPKIWKNQFYSKLTQKGIQISLNEHPHVSIDKLSKLCNVRKSCSSVTYIPLELRECVEKHYFKASSLSFWRRE